MGLLRRCCYSHVNDRNDGVITHVNDRNDWVITHVNGRNDGIIDHVNDRNDWVILRPWGYCGVAVIPIQMIGMTGLYNPCK